MSRDRDRLADHSAEAGLLASRPRLRGLAAGALILVPVGLVEQWQQGLDRTSSCRSLAGCDRDRHRGWAPG